VSDENLSPRRFGLRIGDLVISEYGLYVVVAWSDESRRRVRGFSFWYPSSARSMVDKSIHSSSPAIVRVIS
jgi:hypothetical protein